MSTPNQNSPISVIVVPNRASPNSDSPLCVSGVMFNAAGTALIGQNGAVATVVRGERASADTYYDIAEARLGSAANIEQQAYSASFYNNFCVIPTVLKDYQGNPGTAGTGAVVEPSMLYFPQGWNGWEFWMVVSPYDGANAQYENPSIYCSHDGKNWVVPAGASNPLVIPPNAVDHNFDNTIFMLEDGVTMGIVYGQTNSGGARSGFYFITSVDGKTWSSPTAMSGTEYAVGTHYLQTPQPLYDVALGQWTMYSLDVQGTTGTVWYQTATSLAGAWSAPVALTAVLPPGETGIFNLDLKAGPGNEVFGLVQCSTNAGGRVYPARIKPLGSGFGTTIGFGPPLRAANLLTSATQLYRSAMVAIGKRWHVLFGTLIGPNSYAIIPGSVEFDSTAYFSALSGKNGALMPMSQLTGTLGDMSRYSNGLFWDSFNHATLGDCTASGNGSATAWTLAGTGTLAIVANTLMQTVTGNSHAYVSTGKSDIDLKMIIGVLGTGTVFATFRLSDTNNFWRVQIGVGVAILMKVIAGTVTNIAGVIVTTSEANSELKVVCKGNTIRVYWQNLLILNTNDTFNNTATNHGLEIGASATTAISNVLMELP